MQLVPTEADRRAVYRYCWQLTKGSRRFRMLRATILQQAWWDHWKGLPSDQQAQVLGSVAPGRAL